MATLHQWETGDLITKILMNQVPYALTGVAGSEISFTFAQNLDGALRLQPNTIPASDVHLFQVRDINNVERAYISYSGNFGITGNASIGQTLTVQSLNVTTASISNIVGTLGSNIPSLIVTGTASINAANIAQATLNGVTTVTGLTPYIQINDTTPAQTTPTKAIRSVGGQLRVLNSALNADILILDDTGVLGVVAGLTAVGTSSLAGLRVTNTLTADGLINAASGILSGATASFAVIKVGTFLTTGTASVNALNAGSIVGSISVPGGALVIQGNNNPAYAAAIGQNNGRLNWGDGALNHVIVGTDTVDTLSNKSFSGTASVSTLYTANLVTTNAATVNTLFASSAATFASRITSPAAGASGKPLLNTFVYLSDPPTQTFAPNNDGLYHAQAVPSGVPASAVGANILVSWITSSAYNEFGIAATTTSTKDVLTVSSQVASVASYVAGLVPIVGGNITYRMTNNTFITKTLVLNYAGYLEPS